jgi:hypothetical protein
MDAVLDSMFEALRRGNEVYLPSKYWEVLNRKKLYHRPAEVQTAFFEAMYALG